MANNYQLRDKIIRYIKTNWKCNYDIKDPTPTIYVDKHRVSVYLHPSRTSNDFNINLTITETLLCISYIGVAYRCSIKGISDIIVANRGIDLTEESKVLCEMAGYKEDMELYLGFIEALKATYDSYLAQVVCMDKFKELDARQSVYMTKV